MFSTVHSEFYSRIGGTTGRMQLRIDLLWGAGKDQCERLATGTRLLPLRSPDHLLQKGSTVAPPVDLQRKNRRRPLCRSSRPRRQRSEVIEIDHVIPVYRKAL